MSINRITGPMLDTTLDRQAVDLSFETTGDPLLYIDTTKYSINILRRSGGDQALTVNGNLSAGNVIIERGATITTQDTDGNLKIVPNGTGNVYISSINVAHGSINDTVIGNVTPANGTFANVKSTRLNTTVGSTGRVVYSDEFGLADNNNFRYFSANDTMVVGNVISTTSSTNFGNVEVGNLKVTYNTVVDGVLWTGPAKEVFSNVELRYFSSNSTLRSTNLEITGPATNGLLYLDSGNVANTSSYLSFDGLNMTATGITTLACVRVSTNQITTVGTNQDLVIAPNGTGTISVQSRTLTDLPTPINPADAATKSYVDGLISVSSVNTITQGDSSVVVIDDGLPVNDPTHRADVIMRVDGTVSAVVTRSFANVFALSMHDTTVGTVAGRLYLAPFNNEKATLSTNSAMTLPTGQSESRPVLPDVGDIRYNTTIGTIEWWDGSNWEFPSLGTNNITAQTLIPNGVDVLFTLDRVTTTESVIVTIGGTVQRAGISYSVTGNQLTFTNVPLITDEIEVRFLNTNTALALNPIVIDNIFRTVGTSATEVDAFIAVNYRSVRYTFLAKSTTNSEYETGDIFLVHDGVDAYLHKNSTGNVTSLVVSASIDGYGVMRMTATGARADTKVKLHRMYFTDD